MRREFPRKVKQAALARAAGKCEKCTAVLKPREGEVDHILPDILGGEPVLANAQVLCSLCHAEKSADDIRRTRKADRQRDKASGAIKPAGKLRGPAFPKTERPERTTKQPLAPRNLFMRSQPTSHKGKQERGWFNNRDSIAALVEEVWRSPDMFDEPDIEEYDVECGLHCAAEEAA